MSPTAATERPARGLPPVSPATPGRLCLWEDLGRMGYREAWSLQLEHVERLKQGANSDRLFFVEHPHVVTMGRNARQENLLASPERFSEFGVEVHETDRGGDVTYHGPGQLVGYPLLDLKHWKRDVAAYLRALEEVLIRLLGDYGLTGEREPGATGVWVGGAKVAAMGVHLSRWVTSHGFALNVSTDLSYFDHIIPCGLTRPVASLERLLGEAPPHDEIRARIIGHFGEVFGHTMEAAGREK